VRFAPRSLAGAVVFANMTTFDTLKGVAIVATFARFLLLLPVLRRRSDILLVLASRESEIPAKKQRSAENRAKPRTTPRRSSWKGKRLKPGELPF